MSDTMVHTFHFLVTFDARDKSITITGEDLEDHTIRIPQGLSMLVFELKTIKEEGSDLEAQFPTYPIEWFLRDPVTNLTRPIPQPECFQVQFFNEQRCTILDFNSVLRASEKNEHPFNVVVAYNNKTYGSDPTIVNQPPDL